MSQIDPDTNPDPILIRLDSKTHKRLAALGVPLVMDPLQNMLIAERSVVVRDRVGRLDPLGSQVISRRYGLEDDTELTLEETGKPLGLSKTATRSVESLASSKLRMRPEDLSLVEGGPELIDREARLNRNTILVQKTPALIAGWKARDIVTYGDLRDAMHSVGPSHGVPPFSINLDFTDFIEGKFFRGERGAASYKPSQSFTPMFYLGAALAHVKPGQAIVASLSRPADEGDERSVVLERPHARLSASPALRDHAPRMLDKLARLHIETAAELVDALVGNGRSENSAIGFVNDFRQGKFYIGETDHERRMGTQPAFGTMEIARIATGLPFPAIDRLKVDTGLPPRQHTNRDQHKYSH